MNSITVLDGQLTGLIEGKLPSMKNGREIVYVKSFGGKRRPISKKSDACIDFFNRIMNTPVYGDRLAIPLGGKLQIEATVYYDSLRQDLDIEALCDALQAADLILNDRLLWKKTSERKIDKERPRVEFKVSPLVQ